MKRVRIDRSAAELSTNPIMVGDVFVQYLTPESTQISVAVVSFPNGARNIFHTHQAEQVLVITEGEGMVATADEEMVVSAGDAVYIPAGESHWHGARPDTSMVHLAIMLKA
jgi:quercetin dioxygenase-like cupin family protein